MDERLATLIAGITEKRTDDYVAFLDGGQKFIRISTGRMKENDDGEKVKDSFSCSVYCFVAAADGHNRTLGSWKQGDIFKPASYKAPAKTPRGNIFNDDNGLDCCGPYGVAYLR